MPASVAVTAVAAETAVAETATEAEETRQAREAELDEVLAAENRSPLRRSGLPTTVLLNRHGDLFLSRPISLTKQIQRRFEVRVRLCRNANLPDDAVLPIHLQKQAQEELMERWVASAKGQRKLQLVIGMSLSSVF
jgi:hypothetical protein